MILLVQFESFVLEYTRGAQNLTVHLVPYELLQDVEPAAFNNDMQSQKMQHFRVQLRCSFSRWQVDVRTVQVADQVLVDHAQFELARELVAVIRLHLDAIGMQDLRIEQDRKQLRHVVNLAPVVVQEVLQHLQIILKFILCIIEIRCPFMCQ